MPDRRTRTRTRWLVVGLMVMAAGITIIVVVLLSRSSATDASDAAERSRPVEPVAPINPADKNTQNLGNLGSAERYINPADPFASSYGGNFKHTVSVRISANGPVNLRVRYRDGKDVSTVAVGGGYSDTRTFKGGLPLVAVAIQIIPSATRGTCSVEVDGVEVAKNVGTKPGFLTYCVG